MLAHTSVYMKSAFSTAFLGSFICSMTAPDSSAISFTRLKISSFTSYPLGTAREQSRSEEHTSELQSRGHIVCRLLLEKKNLSKRCLYSFFGRWECLCV